MCICTHTDMHMQTHAHRHNVYIDIYTRAIKMCCFPGKKELEKKRSRDRTFGNVTTEVLDCGRILLHSVLIYVLPEWAPLHHSRSKETGEVCVLKFQDPSLKLQLFKYCCNTIKWKSTLKVCFLAFSRQIHFKQCLSKSLSLFILCPWVLLALHLCTTYVPVDGKNWKRASDPLDQEF